MTTEPTSFNNLLLSVIDETLSSLGESVRQAIFFHIENEFSINRKQIPENLQAFQEGLEKIFGNGARFIELLVMKNLHAMTGNSLVIEGKEQLEFVEYMGVAKQSYLRNIPEQTVESKPCTLSFLPAFTVSVSKP
jgi:hypothetical protein